MNQNSETSLLTTLQNSNSGFEKIIYQIAMKYNTTVKAIVDLNYLKNNNLYVGQVLRIPETYTKEEEIMLPNYINYTVKKGDTLYSVARENNVSVSTLMQDNGLTTNSLTIGQNLKIRVPNNGTIIIEECIGPDYTPPDTSTTTTYTVKSGDSLYSIAKKYNTTISAITNLNNLTSNNLKIGQQLKIPVSPSNQNTSMVTYTVKIGDNLYSIARKYNTTVDAIKKKNNLTSNNLSIGQKLII